MWATNAESTMATGFGACMPFCVLATRVSTNVIFIAVCRGMQGQMPWAVWLTVSPSNTVPGGGLYPAAPLSSWQVEKPWRLECTRLLTKGPAGAVCGL